VARWFAIVSILQVINCLFPCGLVLISLKLWQSSLLQYSASPKLETQVSNPLWLGGTSMSAEWLATLPLLIYPQYLLDRRLDEL
jgi:hypothetical protein